MSKKLKIFKLRNLKIDIINSIIASLLLKKKNEIISINKI